VALFIAFRSGISRILAPHLHLRRGIVFSGCHLVFALDEAWFIV